MSTFSNITPATPHQDNDIMNDLLWQLNDNTSPSGTAQAPPVNQLEVFTNGFNQ
jgi:hypothetical protein